MQPKLRAKGSILSPEPGLLNRAKSLFSPPPPVPAVQTSTAGDVLFARLGMTEDVSLVDVFEGTGRKITISRAAEARSRVVGALREGLRSGILVGLCEIYVRYLQDLMDLEEKLRRRAGLWQGVFRWSSSMAHSEGWFQSGSYGFEVGMMLSTYAMAIIRAALDTDETDILTSKNMEQLNEQSKQFQRAAGIFQHLETALLPNVIAEVGTAAPPDVHPDIARSLKQLALAMSQIIALRLAALRSMSPGTCSKIAQGANDLLQDSASSARSPSDHQIGGISARYFETNEILIQIMTGLAHKFLATDAYNSGKHGAAVTHARMALSLFNERVLKHSLMQRGVAMEKQGIVELFQKYETENSRIYYEQEPSLESLPAVQGRVLVKAIPYVPAKAPHVPVRKKSRTNKADA